MSANCQNRLTLVGHNFDVKGFVDRAGKSFVDRAGGGGNSLLRFGAFVPAGDSYALEREAWGVKWGAYNESLIDYSETTKEKWMATYKFDTTPGTPNVFLKKVSAMYRGVTFLYSWVEGYLRRGRWIIKDGFIDIVSEEANCNHSSDAWDDDNYLDLHAQWVEAALFARVVEQAISE